MSGQTKVKTLRQIGTEAPVAIVRLEIIELGVKILREAIIGAKRLVFLLLFTFLFLTTFLLLLRIWSTYKQTFALSSIVYFWYIFFFSFLFFF